MRLEGRLITTIRELGQILRKRWIDDVVVVVGMRRWRHCAAGSGDASQPPEQLMMPWFVLPTRPTHNDDRTTAPVTPSLRIRLGICNKSAFSPSIAGIARLQHTFRIGRTASRAAAGFIRQNERYGMRTFRFSVCPSWRTSSWVVGVWRRRLCRPASKPPSSCAP